MALITSAIGCLERYLCTCLARHFAISKAWGMDTGREDEDAGADADVDADARLSPRILVLYEGVWSHDCVDVKARR